MLVSSIARVNNVITKFSVLSAPLLSFRHRQSVWLLVEILTFVLVICYVLYNIFCWITLKSNLHANKDFKPSWSLAFSSSPDMVWLMSLRESIITEITVGSLAIPRSSSSMSYSLLFINNYFFLAKLNNYFYFSKQRGEKMG